MYNYLEQLNESQREAVENYQGPTLVIAGAGSGKTRVLTFRIAHLLRNGVHPLKVLALTFTNKAAKEMKERISTIVGESNARMLWMGTFHSIFARILRFESKHIGYPSSFTIYDNADSQSLVKKIIKDLQLNDKQYKPTDVFNRISKAKNNLLTYRKYQNSQYAKDDIQSQRSEIGRIYQIYAERCHKSGVMDFDDLLLNINILFEKHPEVLEKYQKRFEYVLVDEYQDTNTAQYMVLKRLAAKHHNICAVGDDSQSIYAFRGAKIENILNFQKDYPENRLVKLEQNYRSTQNIVEAANGIIARNKKRIPKLVFTENEIGTPIKIIEAKSDLEEGFIVVNNIFRHTEKKIFDFEDYAILYRTNAQSRIFEEHLRKNNIPYKIYGGLSFYQRKEIKDMLAYFRLIINNNDEEALRRIINYPRRGIGKTSFERIEQAAVENSSTIWNVMQNTDHFGVRLTSAVKVKLTEFSQMIRKFSANINSTDAFNIALAIAQQAGILKDLHKDKSNESQNRYQNVQELLNGIKEFANIKHEANEKAGLDSYMEDIALMTSLDESSEEDTNRVVLMTVHSSKGLEFNNVFVVGIEENLFPSQRASQSMKDIEEERRLFYVAITRAKKNLYLSYAKARTKWNDFAYCTPSRFLHEIDNQFVEYFSNGTETFDNDKPPQKKVLRTEKSPLGQTEKIAEHLLKNKARRSQTKQTIYRKSNTKSGNFKADHPNKIKAGMQVQHKKFGNGKVIKIEGTQPNAKAIIDFALAGEKTLLLKFAKLKIVL